MAFVGYFQDIDLKNAQQLLCLLRGKDSPERFFEDRYN